MDFEQKRKHHNQAKPIYKNHHNCNSHLYQWKSASTGDWHSCFLTLSTPITESRFKLRGEERCVHASLDPQPWYKVPWHAGRYWRFYRFLKNCYQHLPGLFRPPKTVFSQYNDNFVHKTVIFLAHTYNSIFPMFLF